MRLAQRDYGVSPGPGAPAVVWEEPFCLLCEGKTWAPVLEAADPLGASGLRFLIVKCHHCGLCFTNPRPDFQSIRHFYPVDYACHLPKNKADSPRKKERLGKLLPVQGAGKLLDFGCGSGDFVETARNLGWHAVGLDPAAALIERLGESRGLPMHAGTLPQPLWAYGAFDAITMWQSLEHVHHPLDVLRDAYRLLTPGGRLLVTVPNVDSFSAYWFRSHWYGLDLPRHLTHFTVETLRGMLQQAGFENITFRQEQRHSWIRHSSDLAHVREAQNFSTYCLRTRMGSRLAGTWGRLCGRAENIFATAVKD